MGGRLGAKFKVGSAASSLALASTGEREAAARLQIISLHSEKTFLTSSKNPFSTFCVLDRVPVKSTLCTNTQPMLNKV